MMPHAVLTLRQALYLNGYSPMAIRNGTKFPTQRTWPELARRDPPEVCWRAPHPAFLGTGILCDGLRPVDVDIDDPVQAAVVRDYLTTMFGAAPIRSRSNSPRILALYRAADGEPPKAAVKNKVSGAGVEVLGRGNQFFAFGTHPSGVPIDWMMGPDVVTRDHLPPITDEQCGALLQFCAALIGAHRVFHRLLSEDAPHADDTPHADDAPRIEPALPVSTANSQPWFIGDIRAALAEIPNDSADYDFWYAIAASVFAACNGSVAGFQAWQDWSAQCIAYSARETDKLWRSLHHSPPNQITAGKLWWCVRQHNPDWDKPSRTFSRLRIFENRK